MRKIEMASYCVLIGLLLLACFSAVAAWLAFGFVLLISLFFNKERLIGLYVFIFPFERLFFLPGVNNRLFFIIKACLVTEICLRYLIDWLRRKQKLQFAVLVPAGILFLYMLLPMHQSRLSHLLNLLAILAVLYVAYACRHEINFAKIGRLLAWGVVLAGLFSLLRPVSGRLSHLIPPYEVFGQERFHGLSAHPNTYAGYALSSLAFLLFAYYQRRISLTQMLVPFSFIFVFGYLTLSRTFVLGGITALVVFALLCLVKRKQQAIKVVSVLAGVTLLVALVFFDLTKTYALRFTEGDNLVENEPDLAMSVTTQEEATSLEEWWEKVYRGEIHYDPGRSGLWKLYLRQWRSSPSSFIFGRGISAPMIGCMAEHNMFVEIAYRGGLIGLLLYLWLAGAMIFTGKRKNWRALVGLLIVLLPFFVLGMAESTALEIIFYLPFVVSLGCLDPKKRPAKVLFYNGSLSLGGTDKYMVNVIENCDHTQVNFDVLVNSDEKLSKDYYRRLQCQGTNVTFLGQNKLSQMVHAAWFFTQHCNQYDALHINATSGAMGILALLGAEFGNIPRIVFHSHMGGNDHQKTIVDNLGVGLAKLCATDLVACSQRAAEFMYGPQAVRRGKIKILNNFVDLEKFAFNPQTRQKYRESLHLGDAFVVLHIGRFVPQKNHQRLLMVFRALLKKQPNCRLVLVGVGPLQDEIRAAAADLKNKVLFLNERDDVPQLLQAADVFVMTSVHEGLPLVAVEAQASGLPVVLSSNITTETNLTGHCSFVDLAASDNEWAQKILAGQNLRQTDVAKIFRQRAFDTASATQVLQTLYLGERQ